MILTAKHSNGRSDTVIEEERITDARIAMWDALSEIYGSSSMYIEYFDGRGMAWTDEADADDGTRAVCSDLRDAPMTRKPTQIGIAAPAQVNERPSGRYHVIAPDAPVGSVLRVTARDGVTRFVQVVCPHEKRLFVGIDGEPIEFGDWDYATREEVDRFKFGWRVGRFADDVDTHGAPAFAATVHALPSVRGRVALLKAVAEELESRGRVGKASQIRAFLEGEKR